MTSTTPGYAVVDTRSGPVRGRVRGERGIAAFRGIPYAAAPVGPLRFRAPEPPAAWTAPRDALDAGPTAPQHPGEGPLAALLPRIEVPGEDCLNLNVWTPGIRGSGDGSDGDAAVMVFLHGGAFVSGSGSIPLYDGERFARDGVVLVTVNYRLGAEGFLWTDDGVPNRGLLDQIAALEWVRDNISAFGGDPARVTVFGESAGAMSVCALLAMPRAAGLFRRAVAQSGAGESAVGPDSAARVTARLARLLEVAPTLDAIAAVPVPRLHAACARIGAEVAARPRRSLWGDVARTLMPFGPVIDGVTLPGLPRELIAAGAGHDVDLLIGTNAEEARLFFVPTEAIGSLSVPVCLVLASAYGARPLRALRSYRRRMPGATPGDLACAILTDGYYRVPALRLAARHPRAHVYEFAWRSSAYGGRLGACHALELPFVFDRLDDPEVVALLGGDAPAGLAHRMHTAWVEFARTGDPGWPAFTPHSRVGMRFDAEPAPAAADATADPRVWPQLA